ncbi:MAG: rhodanese-like domain-containing protein [Bacteroidales bacterium]|nr:rhodanese-like domain-containing protein [Bacteroidales bacterium]
MVRCSIVLVLLLLTSCSVQKQEQEQEKEVHCSRIIPEDFYVRMESNPDVLVLDTRVRSEYAKERIPGARFAGKPEELDQLLDTLDKGKPLFIYCEYGDRTDTVCWILKNEKHFRNVYILKGGYELWKKVNLPVDKSRREEF